MPCIIIASATLSNPAMLAPAIRLNPRSYLAQASADQAAADQAATKPEDGKPGAVDQAKKADAAAKKAGASAKAGQKALPKTHAVK